MSEKKPERAVLSVRAPAGTEYSTVDGMLRLAALLSYRGEAGVDVNPITGLPSRQKDGSWRIWVGRKENVPFVKAQLSESYGLIVEETEGQ
jgi:hypothetical protein